MENNFRFDISPHVIKQLGKELVSDEITALMELVKNSYDADASFVSLEINTIGIYENEPLFYKNEKGYIVVEDDGFGMDEETIIKSWLTISYSNKRGENGLKQKTPSGRTPLGEKGLGRLSTQRLANYCEIFTSKEDSSNRIQIAFNWNDFEKVETLSKVPITLVRLPKARKGTKLILSQLNNADVWRGENLERFKGLLSQMISPYKQNRPFEVFININGQNIDLIQENDDLREIAVSKFEFNFDGDKLIVKGKIRPEKLIGNRKEDYLSYISPDRGKKFGVFFKEKKSDKTISLSKDQFLFEFTKELKFDFDISDLEMIDGVKANPGAFLGEINEFSYDNWITNDERLNNIFDNISNYKKFAQSQAGIKLYRDGFAIKPFGLNGQDWLKLGEGQTTATSYYYMRPLNVIGFVSISENTNYQLKDKTDREGLLSNPYSENFLSMMMLIRNTCNMFLESVRRTYNDFLKTYKTTNNQIKTVSQAFSELKISSSNSLKIKDEFNTIQQDIIATRKKTDEFIKISNNSPLFVSEEDKKIAKALEEINIQLAKAENLLNDLRPLLNRVEHLSEVVDIIEPKIQTLEEQLDNFSELASLGLTAETITHEFSNIADNLAEKSIIYSDKLRNKTIAQSDIYVLIEYINSTVNGLKVQLKHIDPALKYNREKKSKIGIKKFFEEDEYDYYSQILNKNKIDLFIDIRDDFDVNINKGKFTQVFDNLFKNSEYWLKERYRSENNFKPQIKILIEKPWVYFSDNGYGIANSIKDSIFEPFVTTKPKGTGRGLGLFIVQQLLDSSGCTIALEPELNELKRHYIFSINLSSILID